MAFKNEYVPKLEDETSDFFKAIRKRMRVGHSRYDMWTVDRDNYAALVRTGAGHEPESANDEYWTFMDRKGIYRFTTTLLSSSAESAEIIHMERRLQIWLYVGGDTCVPDEVSLRQIKLALEEQKDYCAISKFKRCNLTLRYGDKVL